MLKTILAAFIVSISFSLSVNGQPDNAEYVKADVPKSEVECLAKNMYFEAKNEPKKGIIAVGFVTMNRVNDKSFPKSICGVVYQKVNETCQFSWVCERGANPSIQDKHKYNAIYQMAHDIAVNYDVLKEYNQDPSKGSLFFHAAYINPGWNLHRVITIGQHIFYKRKNNDK